MQSSDRIARRINLHDLQVLMAVVQAGSMNKAAVVLNMSQPTVSRSIAELERAVGVRLLDRNAQGAEPTANGRALLDGGTAVFDDLRQAVKNIEFLADPAAGEVRIGCNPLLAATFVSAVVDRLTRRYPRVVSHLATAAQVETLYRELNDRNLDLLIRRRFGPVADERHEFEFLFDDSSFYVVAGAQSPWVRRRKIALAELVNESWVLPPPDGRTGSHAMDAFRANGLAYPRTTVITGDAHLRISLLTTGHFLTILSASVLRFPNRLPEVKVLPVELPTARVSVGITTLKNRTLNPVARLFMEHARDVAKPPAKRKG